nr:aromatic acid exporter family protein [Vagococcus elongatus]
MKIGMRTVKTGLSVFICILISILLKRETYVVSSITAIFTLREDIENTVKFGKHRVVGNVLGAILSLLVIAIFDVFGKTELVQLIAIPLVIVLMITILSTLGYQEGTVGASATLLTILFMIPSHQSYSYALDRIIDSFIGMFIAFGMNFIIPCRPTTLAENKKEEN